MLGVGWEQQLRYSSYLNLEIAGLETKTYPEDSLPVKLQHGWRAGGAPALPKGSLGPVSPKRCAPLVQLCGLD